jgi:hypothetical protein
VILIGDVFFSLLPHAWDIGIEAVTDPLPEVD